jgi:5-methylcytosine-specific restriction protein A
MSSKPVYGRRWNKLRRLFLAHNPLCRFCERAGRITLATVVDHITPHRGDRELFWDQSNWQPLCKRCHDSTKQSQEKRDDMPAVDAKGYPTDGSW